MVMLSSVTLHGVYVCVRACVRVCVLLGEYIFMKTCLVHVANGSSTGQVQKTSFYLKVVTNNQQ